MVKSEELKEARNRMEDRDPDQQNPNLQELYDGSPVVVIGEVVERKDIGQDNDILILRTEEHGKRDAWIRTVLQGELENKKVTTGSLVGLKYFGKTEPKTGGREYYNYSLDMIERNSSGMPVYEGRENVETTETDEEEMVDIPF